MLLYHLILVLALLWFISSYFSSVAHQPLPYILSFLYLYLVNDHHTQRLQRRIQFEERNNANQSRLLSDSESARWLNHAIAKIWPICMEQIASQLFLLPIIPWFLDKYKPWTAQKAVVQHLYLGRRPPVFNKIRVLAQSADDDHLVLEVGMSFLSGDDMSATLSVQLRKSLGFGMSANMHVTSMHVEGKVLVGVKFLQKWPFIGRLRMSFVEPPYFQMTAKPLFTHGIDVTEIPGIAGWLDRLLSVALQQTLVEPNMLVVDVEKFVSSPSENWFTMDEKPPAAIAVVEVIEGVEMNPSDLNGLADPYVKGRLGNFRFRTKIQWKTLNPKWHERFKIPINSWEEPNLLVLEVRDKDRIFDDTMGNAKVDVSDLRGGERHDKWLVLENIKMGRLHLAITVLEDNGLKDEELDLCCEKNQLSSTLSEKEYADKQETSEELSVEQQLQSKPENEYEPINIEGQDKTGIWVHHPGSDVPQTWEPRQGSWRRQGDINLEAEEMASGRFIDHGDGNSSDEKQEGKKGGGGMSIISKGFKRFSSALRRSPRDASSSGSNPPTPSPRTPRINLGDKTVNTRVVTRNEKLDVVNEGGGMQESEYSAGKGPKEQTKKILDKVKKSINKGKGDVEATGEEKLPVIHQTGPISPPGTGTATTGEDTKQPR